MAILPYPSGKPPTRPLPAAFAAPRSQMMPLGSPTRRIILDMPTPDPIPPLKEEVARIVVERLAGWRSQAMAAALIDIDQPRMSDLRNERLTRFSLEKLIRCASRLGAEFHFTVTWDRRKRFLAAGAKPAHNSAPP